MKKAGVLLLLLVFSFIASAQTNRDFSDNEVLECMKKASAYMAEKVSCNGGYLWYYSEDFSQVFGEVPARKSMIWLQSQGTPAMGELFLGLFRSTGDEAYLDYAKRAANALVYGQHPLGGWHYFIDFDKKGLEGWYRDTASQFVLGWEEFRYYYGNCTYDDNVTQGATLFLLHLYQETLDPAYLGPLRKALDFMIISQYPNGGWPQRYPLRYDFAHDGFPDYTSCYTLNDGAMNHIIDVLLEAYEFFGSEEYLEAARRGGDFFMLAQGPEGHAGWTDQFDMKLQPTAGRTHEPASFQVRYTTSTIRQLEKLFLYTGDRRYLRPIPMALDWMESSILELDEKGKARFATWYDPGTNFPIIRKTLPEVTPEGYIKYAYVVDSSATFLEYSGKLPERIHYEKIRDVEPGREREMYEKLYEKKQRKFTPADEKKVSGLMDSVNENGIWMEQFTVHDISKTMEPNFEAIYSKGDYKYAVKELKGISTRTYINNMQLLMSYLCSRHP